MVRMFFIGAFCRATFFKSVNEGMRQSWQIRAYTALFLVISPSSAFTGNAFFLQSTSRSYVDSGCFILWKNPPQFRNSGAPNIRYLLFGSGSRFSK